MVSAGTANFSTGAPSPSAAAGAGAGAAAGTGAGVGFTVGGVYGTSTPSET